MVRESRIPICPEATPRRHSLNRIRPSRRFHLNPLNLRRSPSRLSAIFNGLVLGICELRAVELVFDEYPVGIGKVHRRLSTFQPFVARICCFFQITDGSKSKRVAFFGLLPQTQSCPTIMSRPALCVVGRRISFLRVMCVSR